MTALAQPSTARRSTPAHRIGSVIRLHFANPATLVVVPLIVMAAILAVNVAIWVIVDIASATPKDRADAVQGFSYSGSTAYVFAYMLVVAVIAMNATFRFAQGFGATRRDYYLGTIAVFGLLSVGYTALLIVLGLIERATGGWWLGGRMFTPVYLGDTWGVRIVVVLCLFLLCFFVGSAFGAVFVRWRRTGLMIAFGIVLAVLVTAALVIALLGAVGAVFTWIGANAPLGLALWSLVPTAVAAVVGFAVLRRTTPAA